MPDPEPKDSQLSPRGQRSRLVFLLPVVLLAGGGIWFWASRSQPAAAQPAEEPRVKSTLHLETFVLNLADTDQRSYLRVGVDLGLGRELKHDDSVPLAQVRDTILGVLAEGKVDELLTSAGKTRLKGNIFRALQQRVPQLGVEEVYFTEFLIQR